MRSTLQGSEPLVGEVVVGLQSLNASLENLLLLLHLLNPQLQLPLLCRSPLGQLLLPAFCCLQEDQCDFTLKGQTQEVATLQFYSC